MSRRGKQTFLRGWNMKAVFRYPGSKWSMAEWIIGHFPPEYEKMV